MKRVNTTTWSDTCTITRLIGNFLDAAMKYQPYSLIDPETGRPGKGKLDGDGDVIVQAIYLRNRLDQMIEKSNAANKR